jgi:hypothetical protein
MPSVVAARRAALRVKAYNGGLAIASLKTGIFMALVWPPLLLSTSTHVSVLSHTWTISHALLFAFFVMCGLVVNLWTLQMPGYGRVAVVDGLYLGMLGIFGGAATMLAVLLCGALKAWRERNLFEYLHPVASFGVGGMVFHVLAPHSHLLAFAVATVVVGWVQAMHPICLKLLHHGIMFHPFMVPLRRVWLYVFVLGPLGLLLYVSAQVAPIALLLLLLPFAMMHRSLRDYTMVLNEARATIEEMAQAVEKREPYTAQHSERVARYAERIARQMRLPEDRVEAIISAGKLHDVGKIGVADKVLAKGDALTEDEFEEVKRHTDIGSKVASHLSLLRGGSDIARFVRHHHEWYDGSGYPDQLSGHDIPLGARILAVAEAWDTMTTTRAWRSAMPPPRALARLWERSGSQFDPQVVNAFQEVLRHQEEEGKR